jgi:hypothetical protein
MAPPPKGDCAGGVWPTVPPPPPKSEEPPPNGLLPLEMMGDVPNTLRCGFCGVTEPSPPSMPPPPEGLKNGEKNKYPLILTKFVIFF